MPGVGLQHDGGWVILHDPPVIDAHRASRLPAAPPPAGREVQKLFWAEEQKRESKDTLRWRTLLHAWPQAHRQKFNARNVAARNARTHAQGETGWGTTMVPDLESKA